MALTRVKSSRKERSETTSPKYTNLTLLLACTFGILIGDYSSFFLQSWDFPKADTNPQDFDHDQPPSSPDRINTIRNPLAIPSGRAIALPSVRIEESDAEYDRKIYGGKGDKPHLGGFTELDPDGISPPLWKWMIEYIGVKSLLDVGCGRGTSTTWFQTHGVDASCVEGSHDALENSFISNMSTITEHDFSRGPWWPEKTVDAVWTVELLEHIGRNYHENLFPAFRKAGVIFASHSTWGGWHHVEVHEEEWWILKFESFGFKYSPELTKVARGIARAHKGDAMPNGGKYVAQHLWLHLLVFINPMVAALPQHHHLFADPGCYDGKGTDGKRLKRHCGYGKKPNKKVESKLPETFLPIKLDKSMDDEWEQLIFGKTGEEFEKKQQ